MYAVATGYRGRGQEHGAVSPAHRSSLLPYDVRFRTQRLSAKSVNMMKRYRLTLLFAATAVVAIAVAAVVVNLVVGNLAEDNLVKMAENNALREAIHVEALIRGQDPLGGETDAAPREGANVGSGSASGPRDDTGGCGRLPEHP